MINLFLVQYKKILFLFITFYIAFSSSILLAKDFRSLYTKESLEHVQKRYGGNIRGVLFEDINNFLLPDERQSLSTITLNIPLYHRSDSLFDFAMNLQTGEMIIPALSIKFFDDMAVAFAWYESKGLNKAEIGKYLSKLFLEPGYMIRPNVALNIPEKAWEQDPFVNDVSQKTLQSGLAFLLLHELGHWHYKHTSSDKISHKKSQYQETQADSLALNVMERMHIAPLGIVIWFSMTGLFDNYSLPTHPLSSSRLIAISERLESNPLQYISRENQTVLNAKKVLNTAKDLRDIAGALR